MLAASVSGPVTPGWFHGLNGESRSACDKFGLACDNLISAEVVLADGSVVRASEREHADLFWGIRGGGGNFGIVTEFEFRLHPLGPIVLAGLAMFPIDRASDVLRRWRDWADAAPDELSTGCAVILAPPEDFVPPELRGRPVLGIPVLYVGDPEAGAAVHVMGHGSARIARAVGVHPVTIRKLVRGDAPTISQQLRDNIVGLYDTWWDKRAPGRTRFERAAATAARKRAMAGNWCAPAALDDDLLDIPGYRPRYGWKPATGTGVAPDIYVPARHHRRRKGA